MTQKNSTEKSLHQISVWLRNRFLHLNIATKMMLGYVPILILLVLVSTVALGNLRHLNRLNASILENDVVVRDISGLMIRSLLDQEYLLRRYLLLKRPDILKAYRDRSTEFTNLAVRIKQLPEGEIFPVDEIMNQQGDYSTLLIEGLDQLGRPDSADGLVFLARVKKHQEKLVRLIKKMRDQAIISQNDKNNAIARIGSSAFRTANILCLFGLLLCIAGATMITRNSSGAIKKLQEATRRISNGDFNHHLEIGNKDELGDLAAAFAHMADRLQHLEEMYLDASPLTRLPGGVAIENILKKRIAAGEPFAFCMMDLDNFKSFNDHYGYAKGNDLIRSSAAIITNAARTEGCPDDFVGHIGGDDFVLISTPERYDAICRRIIKDFDNMAPEMYSDEDRKRGYIAGINRQGVEVTFPVASISIAVVSSEKRLFSNHIQVGEVAAELKEAAKGIKGSAMILDQRTDTIKDSKDAARMIAFPRGNRK